MATSMWLVGARRLAIGTAAHLPSAGPWAGGEQDGIPRDDPPSRRHAAAVTAAAGGSEVRRWCRSRAFVRGRTSRPAPRTGPAPACRAADRSVSGPAGARAQRPPGRSPRRPAGPSDVLARSTATGPDLVEAAPVVGLQRAGPSEAPAVGQGRRPVELD